MVDYSFEFRTYQRSFKQSLKTSHGIWSVREGILLRFIDELGTVNYGEISPLAWFGSETLDQAVDYCKQLPNIISDQIVLEIPKHLSATQFGFESALLRLCEIPDQKEIMITMCGLLPAGETALDTYQKLWQIGYRTFKWKIGVDSIYNERKIFDQLLNLGLAESQLRLDANGGLSLTEAQEWLKICDEAKIEFLEQPLAAEAFNEMLSLSERFITLIALDESIHNLEQIEACYRRGWQDIYVIKPAIVGSPSKLIQFCKENTIDFIFSSVFETAINCYYTAQILRCIGAMNRAIGFGVDHFFEYSKHNVNQAFNDSFTEINLVFEDLWKIL